jgi:aminobenzoyl-glutamate utilization protein B
MSKKRTLGMFLLICFSFISLCGQKKKEKVVVSPIVEYKGYINKNLDEKYTEYCDIAKDIWGYAELGYQETRSAKKLVDHLIKEGFSVEYAVAGLPTSFVATYGSGKPVIGILAEYDALPGLSQDAVPYQKPLVDGGSGHGCGHNLFGTASMAAGVALKDWLKQYGKSGTVRVYGTPAEEGGGGKVYMTRAGLFDDVDVALHWHPGDRNSAEASKCLAIVTGQFKFYGKTAHSAAAPHVGRSALDGAEALNYMVNMMREHVDEKARIHYVFKNGGLAANVVPDYAELEYVIRHPDVEETLALTERIKKAAEGAALGTGTTVKWEMKTGLYNLLPNETLAKVMHGNLESLGGVKYTEEETAWANQLRESFQGRKIPAITQAAEVQPYKLGYFPASTDVGDVSYVVPTAGLSTATWVPGTAAHTWQATAADGMSIGFKGMALAAKTIANTGIDLFMNPAVVIQAKEEFKKQLGDIKYKPLVGDGKPPLDFRKGMDIRTP